MPPAPTSHYRRLGRMREHCCAKVIGKPRLMVLRKRALANSSVSEGKKYADRFRKRAGKEKACQLSVTTLWYLDYR